MNLFLFILVASAVILEAHICLARRQTYCDRPFDNEPVRSCHSSLPEGTIFYYDEYGYLKYCSNCGHIHVKYEDEGLFGWWKAFVSCVCLRDLPDETRPTARCFCECHEYAFGI